MPLAGVEPGGRWPPDTGSPLITFSHRAESVVTPQASIHSPALFRSFWMGGFEGADHVNGAGVALDMAQAHGHRLHLEADHRRAAELGILTVRESIGWRLSERTPGQIDLAHVRRVARSARDHGLQVLWTLMHYGTPADLTLFDDALCDRFETFASRVAELLGPLSDRAPVYNLVNEIGFLAWAATGSKLLGGNGVVEQDHESTLISGYAVKRRLVSATLQAMAAVRRIDPRARFLHIEPVIHVTTPRDRTELEPLAREVAAYQWQVWDLIGGKAEPELGGHPEALDLIGVNHYHAGQWEVVTEERLRWPGDDRRRPLSTLLGDVWARYQRPLVIAETSHFGDGRADWLHEIASEVRATRALGIPVEGICLYPLIDRPDWNDAGHWHHSGLWDVDHGSVADPPALRRVLSAGYAAALSHWQRVLPALANEAPPVACLVVFSHVRWDATTQRPQHLMSRLARDCRVIYVEEPVHSESAAYIECVARGPGLDVLIPHIAMPGTGFDSDSLPVLAPLIADFLASQQLHDWIAWLYAPMALPLVEALKGRSAIVYDCMGDAPRARRREAALCRAADLVLTDGPSLHALQRGLHPDVRYLPSGVDAVHFAPSRLDSGSVEAVDAERLQGAIPHPRLGFLGVVDERFDFSLLDAVARMRPQWQLIIAGPAPGLDPATLPRRDNIHWMGPQSYGLWPALIAGWAACLLPFRLDESTLCSGREHALTSIAGRKPIVSVALPDLLELPAGTVFIASASPGAFVAACEAALAQTEAQRASCVESADAILKRSSWDQCADRALEWVRSAVAAP